MALVHPLRARKRLLFSVVLAVAGVMQLALFAYTTAPGLAGTSDSRLYLHAAHTLLETGRLLNPDGTPYRYWPPLYPLVLAAVGPGAGIRILHGSCLLGSLGLWSWLGRLLLSPRRALLLPLLLALSTPWLLVSKFVWSESLFLLLFAAYAGCLLQWGRSARWPWWLAATGVGFLLPLERTLGLFLLAGIGGGLVLGGWREWLPRLRWPWVGLHLGLSVVGGGWWQWYALHAGPSRYHAPRGWGQLLNSGADYGFVLGRWLLLLPASGRLLLPAAAWTLLLLALSWWLWPSGATDEPRVSSHEWPVAQATMVPGPEAAPNVGRLMLRLLWSASVTLVVLVAGLTVFAQSAAGIHDAERYASVLFGPVLLLVLAAWPARAPRWLGAAAAGVVLLSAAVRVGHVASDLRRVPPISLPGPGAQGQVY